MRDAEPFNFLLLFRLLLVSFALNWIWEMVQMPAFVETAGRSWRDTAFTCALFSLGDAGLTLTIYGVGVVAARHLANMTRAKFYLLHAALGAVVAVVVELVAKRFDLWSYSERMPVLVGLGLVPILQLVTLVPAAVWIAVTWSRKEQSRNSGRV